jgi:predicted nucleic acid-binding protein
MRMNFGPGSLFQGSGELDVWHSFKIYGGQIHAAEAYCEIVPSGTIEVLLAQLCLRHRLCILTLDRDFDHMARFIPLAVVK